MNMNHAKNPKFIGGTLAKCPKCGSPYNGHSAISRVDNKTRICRSCGLKEAIDALAESKRLNKERGQRNG